MFGELLTVHSNWTIFKDFWIWSFQLLYFVHPFLLFSSFYLFLKPHMRKYSYWDFACFNLSSRPLSVCLMVSVPLYYLQEYPVLLCLLKKSVFNTVITCIICTTIVIIIIIHKQTDICQHTAYFVFLHKVTPGPRFEIMSHMYAHTDSKVAHLFWLLICT